MFIYFDCWWFSGLLWQVLIFSLMFLGLIGVFLFFNQLGEPIYNPPLFKLKLFNLLYFFVFILSRSFLISFIFGLESLSLNLLKYFLIFSILASSQLFSLSFTDSYSLIELLISLLLSLIPLIFAICFNSFNVSFGIFILRTKKIFVIFPS